MGICLDLCLFTIRARTIVESSAGYKPLPSHLQGRLQKLEAPVQNVKLGLEIINFHII
jgi:hypothetical protein